MLDSRGKLWITDFGLAHIESNASLTMTGDLMGTLRYMSPEQATGSRLGINHRTDVYSLGVTLYELLTGQPIFAEDTRAALLNRIAHDEPARLRKVAPTVPRDLETIVLRSIAKSAGDRYATAAELAADLRRFLAHEPLRAKRLPLTARLSRFASRHRRLVLAAAAGCLITFLVSFIFIWQGWSQAVAQRRQAEMRRELSEDNFRKAFVAFMASAFRMGGPERPRSPDVAALRDQILQDALAYYDQFCQPDDPNPWIRRQSADAFTHKGYLWQLKGDDQQALIQFHKSSDVLAKLTREFPDVASYWYALGASEDILAALHWEVDAAAGVEHLGRSIQAYEQGCAIDPDDVPRVNGFAWSLVMKHDRALRDPERAIELTQRTLRVIPDRPATLLILGIAQLRAERFDEAVVSLKRAQQPFDPQDVEQALPLPYYKLPLAIALAHTGELEEAESVLALADEWLQTNAPDHSDMLRWRDDARQVLGETKVERAAGATGGD